jgi:hypothetical protein
MPPRFKFILLWKPTGINKSIQVTNHEVRELSNASDGKGVMIKPGKPLTINFCIRVKSKVHLNNLRFSNFNQSALFRVSLDHGKWMGHNLLHVPDQDPDFQQHNVVVPICTKPTRSVGFITVLTHRNNIPLIDVSPHTNTIS